jgi:hypothetical protein
VTLIVATNDGEAHGRTSNRFYPHGKLRPTILARRWLLWPRTFPSLADRCHEVFGTHLDLHTWDI